MFIDQPELRCPKCHSVIPNNKTMIEAWDKACRIADDSGKARPPRPTGSKTGLLACLGCAEKASEGIPMPKKLTRIKNHPDQKLFDVPSIFIK